MRLSPEQHKRYLRQINLDRVGISGQNLLQASKVLVVGSGGLGSIILPYLAGSGIGTIGIIDSDIVELSNLHRQTIFDYADIGKSKALVAKNKLLALNPDIEVIAYNERFENNKNSSVIEKYQLIVDASDNFATKFALNEVCISQKKTFIWGAVQEFSGQVGVVKHNLQKKYPCFECFCPKNILNNNALQNCNSLGVLGSVVGVIASLQTTEILKELLQIPESLAGSILIYDGLKSQLRKVGLSVNSECLSCK